MSDPLRIAVVAEGPTDRIVIEAAMRAILKSREFVVTQLQPEGSLAFGESGSGWVGVYRWCRQSATRGGGRLSDDHLLFSRFDLLVLHLDADIASKSYEQGSVVPRAQDAELPCEQPCPPAADTTNAVRSVLLSWCGESSTPAKSTLCVPSKSTEAWVVAALYPNDPALRTNFECLPNPEVRLTQQKKNVRIKKRKADYEKKSAEIEAAWPQLAFPRGLSETGRFETDFRNALGG